MIYEYLMKIRRKSAFKKLLRITLANLRYYYVKEKNR